MAIWRVKDTVLRTFILKDHLYLKMGKLVMGGFHFILMMEVDRTSLRRKSVLYSVLCPKYGTNFFLRDFS